MSFVAPLFLLGLGLDRVSAVAASTAGAKLGAQAVQFSNAA